MAEGKKAFIVYTDWLKYTDEMTNEQKGIWIDWCLKYCNDLQPELPNDPMAKMLCIMCKDILKRDLKKYENKVISIQNAREKRKYNIESNNEINIENNIGTSGVNSNKLIVNSNKLIVDDKSSNNIEGEELQIENLKQLIRSIEEMFNRCLTNAEAITIQEFSKTMSNESIIRDLKTYSDKTNPIAYMKKMIENARVKNQVERKSEWGKEFKESFKEEKSGSEWLDNFNKKWEDKQ